MKDQIDRLITILYNLSELAKQITNIISQDSKTKMINSISSLGSSNDDIKRRRREENETLFDS